MARDPRHKTIELNLVDFVGNTIRAVLFPFTSTIQAEFDRFFEINIEILFVTKFSEQTISSHSRHKIHINNTLFCDVLCKGICDNVTYA